MLRKPACPNCRYDLSGIAASWESMCPLDGQCSECGIPFQWSRIFAAPHAHIRLFDVAEGITTFELAGSCALAIVQPRTFWAIAATQNHPRAARLALAAVLMPFIGLVALVFLTFPIAAVASAITYFLIEPDYFYELFQPVAWILGEWDYGELEKPLSAWLLPAMLSVVTTPLAFLVLSQSLSRAGVRRSLAIRAYIWSLGWAMLWLFPWVLGGILMELAIQVYFDSYDAFALTVRELIHMIRVAAVLITPPLATFIWYRIAFRANDVACPSATAAIIAGVTFILAVFFSVSILIALTPLHMLWM